MTCRGNPFPPSAGPPYRRAVTPPDGVADR
jgi:hypothetical protein